jgi:hypothetical protein
MGSPRRGARSFFVFSQEEGLISGRGCPWHLNISLSLTSPFSTWTVSVGKRKSVLLLIVWDMLDY